MPKAKKAEAEEELVSLVNFDETNPKATLNSPRTLQACKQEGVLPGELVFKPIEAFQERNLSPRLVKLRFDFFEAKRKDLLAAVRRARDTIMADEKREKGEENLQLQLLAERTGYSKGAILALNGNTLEYERMKLLKAQAKERRWLQNALENELSALAKLEKHQTTATVESNAEAERQAEASRKLKELNDRRKEEEERKALEAEAKQKLEKALAKEEFAKQQEDLERKQLLEAERQKKMYLKQLEEAEKKRQAELEKERKKEAAYAEQEARKNELRAQDLRRQEVMEQQKDAFQVAMREKQEARDIRIYQSIQANQELEQKRREEFEERQRQDQMREERKAQMDALKQEEFAKRSFQLMMKRQVIADEAAKRNEERRAAILEQQEDMEMRLLEHEQKKERYLDFKRELDTLRSTNKEINVERQRRKEEAVREKIADEVRKKDEKIECMKNERNRLWQIRRAAQSEAYKAREIVKSEIIRQRVASKFDASRLQKKLGNLMEAEVFHPKVVQPSASMPQLRPHRSTIGSAGASLSGGD
mmetsp:Transcript_86934/g.243637  ORF Transcript_86934/g.243637 Transcript_86934/m.243637 type:complete len:536 (-) Transcript_86934:115-1722(-)|eukprot:CAMPEP_0117566128 /NCGR_PEP_ID=MMETSP0784-20121206/56932_1 /TAXON_ID=39447 /ORGANISM="" /LENGTH=535 /DNA_ID=CAMNT_0005363959 /DNA_START=73 /DNA_END=1680 /DNA_ORIENTATION=+